MILHLVRHGQTPWNVEGRLLGQSMDVALSEGGMVEANHAAHQLAQTTPGAVWTSDQLRARQTANTVAQRHDVVALPTVLLREQSLGVLEGRLTSELTEQPVPEGQDISEVRWGGGESIEDVYQRMVTLVSQLCDEFSSDDEVILVSHGDTLRVLLALLDGRGHRDVDWAPLETGAVLTRTLTCPHTSPGRLIDVDVEKGA